MDRECKPHFHNPKVSIPIILGKTFRILSKFIEEKLKTTLKFKATSLLQKTRMANQVGSAGIPAQKYGGPLVPKRTDGTSKNTTQSHSIQSKNTKKTAYYTCNDNVMTTYVILWVELIFLYISLPRAGAQEVLSRSITFQVPSNPSTAPLGQQLLHQVADCPLD